tara:strand:+ start:1428 stop:2264 length:837 start_codon:yes stop_codon:yes gene_type:complete
MKWENILKVIQIPKVNLNIKDLKPPVEEDNDCAKRFASFFTNLFSKKVIGFLPNNISDDARLKDAGNLLKLMPEQFWCSFENGKIEGKYVDTNYSFSYHLNFFSEDMNNNISFRIYFKDHAESYRRGDAGQFSIKFVYGNRWSEEAGGVAGIMAAALENKVNNLPFGVFGIHSKYDDGWVKSFLYENVKDSKDPTFNYLDENKTNNYINWGAVNNSKNDFIDLFKFIMRFGKSDFSMNGDDNIIPGVAKLYVNRGENGDVIDLLTDILDGDKEHGFKF